jgi:cytochrome oxidase assembly protein ShyY1
MGAAKTGLFLAPSAVAAGMAAWQIQRMQWKVRGLLHVDTLMHHTLVCLLQLFSVAVQQGVVDEATRNMAQPPVDLLQGSVPEFRRVAVQGTYDHSRAAFIGPRPLRCV